MLVPAAPPAQKPPQADFGIRTEWQNPASSKRVTLEEAKAAWQPRHAANAAPRPTTAWGSDMLSEDLADGSCSEAISI